MHLPRVSATGTGCRSDVVSGLIMPNGSCCFWCLRYLKTTVFGLTGHMPSFVMLLVGANAGVIGMAKEHLGLALALNKPVLVVVTKIDMCPPNVLASTLKLLHRILKSPGCKKMPMLIKTQEDMVDASRSFQSQRLCPIFQVSNVTGENLGLLKQFLNLLRPSKLADPGAPAEVQLDETFSVPGTGTVVSGTCVSGTIRTGDSLMLGPDSTGGFTLTNIRGIHRRRMPTGEVRGGQAASFSLKKVKRSQIRKGMVGVPQRLIRPFIMFLVPYVRVLRCGWVLCRGGDANDSCMLTLIFWLYRLFCGFAEKSHGLVL
eukprot:m.1286248 g.1286248  ORF g.1286248 m.1286248 type:complete len:316 (+) comp24780_c0_seq78:95-1042(+)